MNHFNKLSLRLSEFSQPASIGVFHGYLLSRCHNVAPQLAVLEISYLLLLLLMCASSQRFTPYMFSHLQCTGLACYFSTKFSVENPQIYLPTKDLFPCSHVYKLTRPYGRKP